MRITVSEGIRAVKQWAPFIARTVGYGTISITLGPLTREHGASLWAMKRWCRTSAKGLGLRIDVEGVENVPSGAFVYASNHQSLLDILVLGAVLPGDFKWAAKRSLMKIPFLGWHLQLAGHVPVDRRSGARAAAHVIQTFEQKLRDGKPLLVFPEGTRSEDGILRPFKNGGFYAAVRANTPVVPVAIEGTYKLMRKGALDTGDTQHRPIQIRVGAPLYPRAEGSEAKRVAELRDRTFEAVAELHKKAGGQPPMREVKPATNGKGRDSAHAL